MLFIVGMEAGITGFAFGLNNGMIFALNSFY